MSPLYHLVAIMSLGALVFGVVTTTEDTTIRNGDLDAIATNVLIYRNAVSRYAQNNPLANGSIADSVLALPAWYRKNGALGNYVSSGRSYVFYTGLDVPGLAGVLQEKTESVAVGVNAAGVFRSTGAGNTGIALPAQVPVDSVVILQ